MIRAAVNVDALPRRLQRGAADLLHPPLLLLPSHFISPDRRDKRQLAARDDRGWVGEIIGVNRAGLTGRVAWWRNGRASDLRARGRRFDPMVGVQLRNDYGQVAHTRLPRRRQSSLLLWSR